MFGLSDCTWEARLAVGWAISDCTELDFSVSEGDDWPTWEDVDSTGGTEDDLDMSLESPTSLKSKEDGD